MNTTDFGKGVLGVATWAAVAVFAVIAAANWDPLWGFFPVLGSVLGAWGLGEYVMHHDGEER